MTQSRRDPTLADLRSARAEEDQDAIANVIERYRPRLEGLVAFRLDARVRRRVDPADVLQDALIEALSRIDEYLRDPAVPLFVWLRFIALQRLSQLHRVHLGAAKRDARRDVAFRWLGIDETGSGVLADSLIASGTSPSETLARAERRAMLLEVIEDLDPVDREILALRSFEGLTNAEAASILGMNSSTTSGRYLQALRRIQSALGDKLF